MIVKTKYGSEIETDDFKGYGQFKKYVQENIIQKIIDNRNKIVGIEIDGNFYNVDYVEVDRDNDVALHCYTVNTDRYVTENYYFKTVNTDRHVTENYYFKVKDIKNTKEVKLYRLEEIKE